MKRGVSILVEGVDGAGKTTIARWLSETFNMEYHRGPKGAFLSASDLFNANKVSLDERFAFYTGDNIRASMHIERSKAKGQNIVLDRYFLSTIAYHTVEENFIEEKYLDIFKCLSQPDLVLVINTGFDIITERFKNRYLNDNDRFYLSLEKYNTINRAYKEEIHKYSLKNYFIDNSSDLQKTKTQVESIVNDFISF